MRQQLTTRNAQVTTATVEIKTLTIAGRQVTLAVFRQLKTDHLIDVETGELKGVPWGTVNYHPDKCADQPDHLHVVWQKDDELRRASEPLANYDAYFWTDIIDDYVQAAFCLNDHQLPQGMRRGLDSETGLQNVRFHLDNLRCETAVVPDRKHVPDHRCPTRQEHDELLKEMRDLTALEMARRRKLNEQWHALAALPQLFISV